VELEPWHVAAAALGIPTVGFGAYLGWIWLNISQFESPIERFFWIARNCGEATPVIVEVFRFFGVLPPAPAEVPTPAPVPAPVPTPAPQPVARRVEVY